MFFCLSVQTCSRDSTLGSGLWVVGQTQSQVGITMCCSNLAEHKRGVTPKKGHN